ncbi:MAG TPA: twin-arginine translocase TatA/TatE family subunit [Flavipsychrobacter sp.]|nr:twin-arginine translocase TatA/TatE family subunit [Flavipsychrobacter sp.]
MINDKVTGMSMLLSVPGGWEIIIILVIVVVLFGSKKIPGLARGLGQSVKEFKDAKQGKDEENKSSDKA